MFSQLIEQLILDNIEKINTESVNADQSVLGYGRNTELSRAKRDFANDMRKYLISTSDDLNPDTHPAKTYFKRLESFRTDYHYVYGIVNNLENLSKKKDGPEIQQLLDELGSSALRGFVKEDIRLMVENFNHVSVNESIKHLEKILQQMLTGIDKVYCSFYQAIIEDCKIKADSERNKYHQCTQGEFGKKLSNLMVISQEIYNKIEQIKLIDTVYKDHHPLDILKFHIATYFVKKITAESDATMLGRLGKNPDLTNLAEVADEKSRLLLAKLAECQQDISDLDATQPKHAVRLVECVLTTIQVIKNENMNICNRQITVGHYSLFFLAPSLGTLDQLMNSAKEVISAKCSPKHASYNMSY